MKIAARVHDLKLFIENCADSEFEIDFKNVKFATRSFMDEFYNLFIKDASGNSFSATLTNVPEDISKMLDSVSKTQTRIKTIPETAHVVSFKTVEEFMKYMGTLAF